METWFGLKAFRVKFNNDLSNSVSNYVLFEPDEDY